MFKSMNMIMPGIKESQFMQFVFPPQKNYLFAAHLYRKDKILCHLIQHKSFCSN